jgi:hypothetical protein
MSSRTGGRQSMSELKLRRLIEHNQRLREDLARPRVRVSEASARCVLTRVILSPAAADTAPQRPSLIRYCKTTKDHLVRACFCIRLRLSSLTCASANLLGAFCLGPRRPSRGSLWPTDYREMLHRSVTAPPATTI